MNQRVNVGVGYTVLMLLAVVSSPVSSARADSYSFGATQGITAQNPGQEQIYSNNMGGGLLGATAPGNPGGGKPLVSEVELPESAKDGSGQATKRPLKTDTDKSKWELSELDAAKSVDSGQGSQMGGKDDTSKPGPRGHNLKRRQNP
jgi:hypothetical protein